MHISEIALKMRTFVSNFKLAHRPEEQMAVRIGFHSGSVAAGGKHSIDLKGIKNEFQSLDWLLLVIVYLETQSTWLLVWNPLGCRIRSRYPKIT
jgi:hypothetical protein